MSIETKETVGLGGYNYHYGTERHEDPFGLPEHLKDNEIFKRPFWAEMRELFKGSFVVSSGRQYGQFCDMIAIAAMWREMGKEVDWEVLDSPLVLEAIRSWENVPDIHTASPENTPGLVPGVFEFWWRMFVDAMHHQFDHSHLLITESAIEKRFKKAQVGLGQTSSTTAEEIAGLNSAVADIRDARPAGKMWSSDELVLKSLKWHLKVSMHWLSHNRPRRDRRRGGDVHADYWREGMVAARDVPVDERTMYDHLLVKQADALDYLLNTHPSDLQNDPELIDVQEKYYEVLKKYNDVHKDEANYEPIIALHRKNETSRHLGVAGVLGAVMTG